SGWKRGGGEGSSVIYAVDFSISRRPLQIIHVVLAPLLLACSALSTETYESEMERNSGLLDCFCPFVGGIRSGMGKSLRWENPHRLESQRIRRVVSRRGRAYCLRRGAIAPVLQWPGWQSGFQEF